MDLSGIGKDEGYRLDPFDDLDRVGNPARSICNVSRTTAASSIGHGVASCLRLNAKIWLTSSRARSPACTITSISA